MLRGAARVGPYRWLKHPNYLIVALEITVVPLALGLPVFALVFSIANAALLVYRIRIGCAGGVSIKDANPCQ